MAYVSFSLAATMQSPSIWYGSVISYSSTDIMLTDGYHGGLYHGAGFIYSGGAVVGGTLTDYAAAVGVNVNTGTYTISYTVSGLNLNAVTAYNYIQNGDASGLLSWALSGNDSFDGSSMGDYIIAYAGDDSIVGNAGNDTLDGGDGSDSVGYFNSVSAVQVSLLTNTATGGDGSDTLLNIENIFGSYYNDVLIGNATANILLEFAGNNTLTGGLGIDSFVLSSGIDEITDLGNGGADELFVDLGTTVNATLAAAWTASALTSNNGTVNIRTSGLAVNLAAVTTGLGFNVTNGGTATTLTGSGFSDNITGGAGNDVIQGGAGDDTLNAAAGVDTLEGGAGNDVYIVDTTTDTITENAAEGTDTVNASVSFSLDAMANVENLFLTGAGNNNATGNTLNNILQGNAGNNILIGNGGNDTLNGGLGDDQYAGSTPYGNVTINDTGGIDTLVIDNSLAPDPTESRWTSVARSGANMIANSYSNGVLTGTLTVHGEFGLSALPSTAIELISVDGAICNIINGLTGSAANELIVGSAAAENLLGDAGGDILQAGAGNDTLNGGVGNDHLTGGLGIDNFIINGGSDSIGDLGFGGADVFQVGLGATLHAQVVANYVATAASVNNGTTIVEASGNIVNLSQITSGNGFTILNSDTAANMTGSALNDTVTGGAGNDTLNGGLGVDTLVGGAGNDTYVVNSTTDTITEYAASGVDLVNSSVSFSLATIANVENLVLTGITNINATGNALANTLVGNTGNNILNGGAGNDVINGGAGNDTIYGGAGNDRLTGGLGNDTFVFNLVANPATNLDTLMDFTSGTDVLRFSAAAYAGIGAVGALQPNAFYAAAGATSAHTATDRLIYDTTSGYLYFDADGTGATSSAVKVALIGNIIHPGMAAGDITVA